MKIFLDGKMVDEKDAVISVFDHGLLYGDGVFEGIRAYNGRVFLLEEHVDQGRPQLVGVHALGDGHVAVDVLEEPEPLGAVADLLVVARQRPVRSREWEDRKRHQSHADGR